MYWENLFTLYDYLHLQAIIECFERYKRDIQVPLEAIGSITYMHMSAFGNFHTLCIYVGLKS